MVAFSEIKPGDTLYDEKGRPVRVMSIDADRRTAYCRWCQNPTARYTEAMLERLTTEVKR